MAAQGVVREAERLRGRRKDTEADELLETLWWDAATKTSWTPLLLASKVALVQVCTALS